MSITPYPHQFDFINEIRESFKTHRAVLGCAATGFGKTVVSSYIAQAAVAKGNRVIFTVHRDNLISQTSNTFTEFGIPHGFIAAGMSYDRTALVHVASIETLKRRLDRIEAPALLVVDECHLAMAAGWQQVIDYFKSKGTRVLGNSGSPERLDGKPLDNLFDTMVEGPTVRWLMDNGFLSDYRYYAPSVPDLSKIGKQMGDYNKKQLGEKMDTPKLVGDAVDHYKRLAMGKRTVCFCINVAHSQHMAEAFTRAGVPAAHIDANTPKAERRRILNDFADGKILVLCNVELVTTGFDLSAQVGRDVPVEAVILLRPTMSLALFLQMVGRALRRKPYPAIIIDHAACSQRHGFPDDEREWDLKGRKKAGKKADNDNAPPPPYTCVHCFQQMRRPVPQDCPYCGKRLAPDAHDKAQEIKALDAELVEVDAAMKQQMRAKRLQEEREADSLGALVRLGQQRGYKYPTAWAQKRWSHKHQRRSA